MELPDARTSCPFSHSDFGTCLQAVELFFAWNALGDAQFGAVWHCPRCGEKQHVEVIGRVVRALKTAVSESSRNLTG